MGAKGEDSFAFLALFNHESGCYFVYFVGLTVKRSKFSGTSCVPPR